MPTLHWPDDDGDPETSAAVGISNALLPTMRDVGTGFMAGFTHDPTTYRPENQYAGIAGVPLGLLMSPLHSMWTGLEKSLGGGGPTTWEELAQLGAHAAGTITGAPAQAGSAVFGAGRPGRGPRVPLGDYRDVAPPVEAPPPMGHNAPPAAAPYEQYATTYPPTGPPVLKVDKKKPEGEQEYLGKQLTPEATAFSKVRDRIQKQMDQQGFTPYFDPAQRYDVDPSYYPSNVDTQTLIPVKQDTQQRHLALAGSDEARQRLQEAYQQGTQMPDTARWYQMGQLENEFIKALGPVEGRKAFQDRFATSMAATTGGADPQSNFLMAMYGNYLRANKLDYPEHTYDMPFPIGGRYAGGNLEQHQKLFDQGGYSALGGLNPKRHNFAQNFLGNPNVATMDEQMTSGMTPGLNEPPWYGIHEQVLREEAAKAGVSPREFQEVGWAGFKNLKDQAKYGGPDTPKMLKSGYTSGMPMIQVVNESIERTHRLTGMPKHEIVLRGIINGEIPLYTGGLPLMNLMGPGANDTREAPR